MSGPALILANGAPPKRRLLRKARSIADIFVCADGGANIAAALNEQPDLIIGDLDSIKSATVKKFKKVKTRRIADQNSTDLEKALLWAIRKGYDEIMVLGATGGRVDHLTSNLSALGKFSRKARIRFVDDLGVMMAVGSELTFHAMEGTTVSLIPLSRCEGIVTNGLKWELKNSVLEPGVRESTSNAVRSSPVSVKVRRGTLLLYKLTNSGKRERIS
ncbi:MAG: thiamine diphosphokinase [Ignavibacteriales bacterium]|nr:thiamine diphosphokinase [Ignavibacteriales bacterium]